MYVTFDPNTSAYIASHASSLACNKWIKEAAQSCVKNVFCLYKNADSMTHNDTAVSLRLMLKQVAHSCISVIKVTCNIARS